MQKYSRIGIDLGKNYFQIHALPSDGGTAINRKLKRKRRSSPMSVETEERLAILCDKALQAFGAKLCQ